MDTISLTGDLMNNISDILEKHDDATQNPSVRLQYLSAVMGVWLAGFQGSKEARDDLLQELSGFMEHVMNEQLGSQPPPQQQKKAEVGIWKPE
jgi:hypothetical protein